ncbi:MAG: TRAP transporter substrate-binding protein DctP [Chloroflexi bacterium]|nr:TRAP transporter substrate-binding protein DctP [Chloroflexota bacterium]
MVLLGAGLLAACSSPSPTQAPPPTTAAPTTAAPTPAKAPVKLVHSSYSNKTNSENVFDEWYLNEISRRSGGLVVFELNFNGSLTAGTETLPAVRSGAVDLSNPPPAYFASQEPLHNLFSASRGTDVAGSQKVLVDLEFGTSEISKLLKAESEANNIKYLVWHPLEYKIMTKNKVEKLADLKGMKIRSVGNFEPPVLQEYGAIPVNALWPEIYEAISRGTLDGAPTPTDWMVPYKIHEAAKFVSFSAGTIGSSPLVININSFNKLPDEVKAIIDDPKFREEANQKLMQTWGDIVEKDRKTAEAAGVTFVTVDPAEQEKLWDGFKKVTLNVYPADLAKLNRLDDALKILDAWLTANSGQGLKYWDDKFGIKR